MLIDWGCAGRESCRRIRRSLAWNVPRVFRSFSSRFPAVLVLAAGARYDAPALL